MLLVFISLVPRAADAQEPAEDRITFRNGSTELAASVLVPEGEGPFPAAVIVHGSGTSDRSNLWTSAWASALVKRGILILHPDKRGSGESGGDWRSATFRELAGDAVAAVEALVTRSDVDTSRVAVIGFSQGGDIVPVAAAMSPDIDMVVDVSGSVVPILEQIGDELQKMARREGLTEDQVDLVGAIHEHGTAYVLEGASKWGEYAAALAEAERAGIADSDVVSGFPQEQSSPAWDFLRTIGDFDPLPYWKELEVPTVFIYGGRDTNVDVFKSVDIIEEQLKETGLPYSLLLFRNNGHALYREDVLSFVAQWLRDGGAD
jgi:pimeloyl-ACP methyl ester carboxylesterase